jgi:outer membrane protein assembly factor BamB
LDNLLSVKYRRRRQRIRRLAVAGVVLLIIAAITLMEIGDYSEYRRFQAFRNVSDRLSSEAELESAIIKCGEFDSWLTPYTRLKAMGQAAKLRRLKQDKNGRIDIMLLAEFEKIQVVYKDILEDVKLAGDFDKVFIALKEIDGRINQVLKEVSQRVLSLGGTDYIVDKYVRDYKLLLEEVHRQISAIETYLYSAQNLYDKAQILENSGEIEKSIKTIIELSRCYSASGVARSARIPVLVESVPVEAEVMLDDVRRGTTPLIIHLPLQSPTVLTVEKKGFGKFVKKLVLYEQPVIKIQLEKAVKWTFNVGTPIRITPLAVDDTVFITTREGFLRSIDSQTGMIRWSFKTDTSSEICASPRLFKNLVMFGADDNRLYAVRCGAPIESEPFALKTNAPIRAPVFITPGNRLILVNSTDNNLYALTDTGALLWTYNANTRMSNGGVADNSGAYVAGVDGVIHAVSLQNGAKIWTLALEGRLTAPVSDGRMLYAGSANGVVYAINSQTGKVQWSYRLPDKIEAPLSISDNLILVPCKSGLLYALNCETRMINWQFKTKGPLPGGVATATNEDIVYLGSEDSCLYAINLADGQELWRYKARGKIYSRPAVSKDAVYICTSDGYLQAIEK